MIEHEGAAPSADQAAAITRGIDAMGVDAEALSVRYTDDFDGAIQQLMGSTTYSSDRGTGTVAAKTLNIGDDSVIVFNSVAIGHADDALIERTAAHEAGHVLLYGRRETLTGHEHIAQSEWEYHLAALASYALEEYRVEKSLSERGYAASGSCDADHLSNVLHWTSIDLFELTSDPTSADPLHLAQGVVGLADRLSKVLAYAGAFDLHGDFPAHLASEGDPAVDGWRDYVEPSWDMRVRLYESIPSADTPIPSDLWHKCLETGIVLEHTLIRSMGFEFRDGHGGAWGFFGQIADEVWRARIERAYAQELLYEAATA